LDDAAPDGVLAVEEAHRREGDEELAVGAVGLLAGAMPRTLRSKDSAPMSIGQVIA
jgi:hypothetical protein